MRKFYILYLSACVAALFLTSSCSKDSPNPPSTSTVKPFATLGLWEVDSGVYKRVFIPVSGVGTATIQTYYLVFDTGSTGLTIDAHGIIPSSLITSSGITVAGDSVVVNGITITNQTAQISYGNKTGLTTEYGNLAYASFTLGDVNGSTTTTRIPFFLYYKIVDGSGTQMAAHSQDVFGVGPGVSYANNVIASPLSYYKSANGVVNGFKLSVLGSGFSMQGTYVRNLLQIGLLPGDISSSSGFVMHPLSYYSEGGYSPDIPSTITYGGKTISATVLFDTGTPAISIIEDPGAGSNEVNIPAGTDVTITTSSGFKYSYTTASADDLTEAANPSYTGDPRTIFSINFFTDNAFLTNYQSHIIGLKNN